VAWRWTARRLAISAFIVFHLSALIIWTIPPCAIKDRFQGPFRYYVLPLGIWQWWAIFAPDPVKENQVLEAEVIDARKIIHIYEFTKIGDLSWWDKMSRYRNPKFTNNMMNGGEYAGLREFAARHAVRQLGLGNDAFPLCATLYAKLNGTPPPGTAVTDPMTPPRIQVLERFTFESAKEVRP
jgi:hypothetical protein